MIELKRQVRKFAIQGSRGADSLRTALERYFGDQLLEVEPGSKDFTAKVSLCRLEKMEVYHGLYEQPFRLQLRHSRCFTQGFPIRGSGEYINNGTAMASSPRKGMLAAPGCISLSYGPNFEHVSIFIDPDALSKTSLRTGWDAPDLSTETGYVQLRVATRGAHGASARQSADGGA